jgi:hypothetical protein
MMTIVPLPYSLRARYRSIAIAWTVIIIPPVFLNLGLFYGLWYGKPEMDRVLGSLLHLLFLQHVTRLTLITQFSPYPPPSWESSQLLQSSRESINSPNRLQNFGHWDLSASPLISFNGAISLP